MGIKKTNRKGFNFFRSYFDVYNELESDKDKIAFIEALFDRQFFGIKPTNLKGMAKFAYISQKNSIDSQVRGYEDKTGIKLSDFQLDTNPTIGACEPPTQGGGKAPTLQEEEKEEEEVNISFDVFWDLYEKKVGDKDKTKKKWDKLKIEDQEKIIDFIPKFKKTISDKKFQPFPSTFLNQKRWNDELDDNLVDTPTKVEVRGEIREIAFYKEDGTPVYKGTTKPTLDQIKAMK